MTLTTSPNRSTPSRPSARRAGSTLTWVVHTTAYAVALVFLGPGIGSLYLIVAGVSALVQLAALPSIRRDPFKHEN